MAFVAAATEVGTRKQVNEDSCCVKVAQTSLGEVAMAMVCDGVGGLSAGNLASATVVSRFSQWFDAELPMLMEGMAADSGAFDFNTVKSVWGVLLQALNDLIYTHGTTIGTRLGTTFTSVITCGGRYLVGHVGDCRAFLLDKTSFMQLTEDQTKVARMLAAGEITAEEAKRMPKNVILQSVGTQRVLAPVFYEGTCADDQLFVICCDGAYHRVENEGIRRMFQKLDFTDEAALDATCHEMLQLDLQLGEKDNLTVVCLCPAPSDEGEERESRLVMSQAAGAAVPATGDEDDMPTMVESAESDEDDMPTMVESAESEGDEDDMPTMVEAAESDEDDMPTMVEAEPEPESDEDDMPTMVESAEGDEDDMPTMVESAEPEPTAEEDEMPTMVEAEPEPESDEDDMPTMVESAEPEPTADEDDMPTMVEAEPEPTADEDDMPTMVEGADA